MSTPHWSVPTPPCSPPSITDAAGTASFSTDRDLTTRYHRDRRHAGCQRTVSPRWPWSDYATEKTGNGGASGGVPEPAATIRCAAADRAAELVERVRTGDSSAWRELVREYEPMLRRIASQYRLPRQDADDVIQLVWLRCLEHLGQLTHADSLRAWLNTICRRECLRLATRERREVLLGEPVITLLIDRRHEEHDAFATAALHEDHARLSRAITALPDRQRLVLLELLEREGRGYADVSRCLGLPVGSIGPTWVRAIDRLRRDPGLADLNPAS